MVDIMKSENKIIYMAGDFNINLINADSHQPTSNFLDVLYSASIFPLINRPTRITSHSATLIDNIFCNEIVNVTHQNGILIADITDHYPVFNINIRRNITMREKYIKRRLINNDTLALFHNKL